MPKKTEGKKEDLLYIVKIVIKLKEHHECSTGEMLNCSISKYLHEGERFHTIWTIILHSNIWVVLLILTPSNSQTPPLFPECLLMPRSCLCNWSLSVCTVQSLCVLWRISRISSPFTLLESISIFINTIRQSKEKNTTFIGPIYFITGLSSF